jgi:Kyakuja-Dileera-Zisupton transposase
MDGNDSAKRMDLSGGREVGDPRVFHSDYFIPNDEVNEMAWDSLRSKAKAAGAALPPDDPPTGPTPAAVGPEVADIPNSSSEFDDGLEGDDVEEVRNAPLKDATADCTKNWKATQSDAKKRAMQMFDETGWFTCGCRHGILFWVLDMIRSGEL